MSLLKKYNQKQYDAGFVAGVKVGAEDAKRLDEELIERKAINMFCNRGYPNPLHVFDVSPTGIPYLNQEPISKEVAIQLKSEATLLKSMSLYDVLMESVKNEAIKKGFNLSTDWEQVLIGKAMATNLQVIKKIIDMLSVIDTDKIPNGAGGSSTDI